MEDKDPLYYIIRPERNGKHIADDIFKYILWGKFYIWIQISLKFVPKGLVDNKSALV